jgi:hypothetical protein
MDLVKKMYRGEDAWFAEFENYAGSWLIGRVSKLPTMQDALRIVNAWGIMVLDGVPYRKGRDGHTWIAYGTPGELSPPEDVLIISKT